MAENRIKAQNERRLCEIYQINFKALIFWAKSRCPQVKQEVLGQLMAGVNPSRKRFSERKALWTSIF